MNSYVYFLINQKWATCAVKASGSCEGLISLRKGQTDHPPDITSLVRRTGW